MKSINSTKICITAGMFSLLFSHFHLKVIKRQKQILIRVGSVWGLVVRVLLLKKVLQKAIL